jgi:lipoate-protein ligase A
MHEWRLVIDDALPGALNMARDQALLKLYPTLQQPTLRMYRWQPACVSLGRAQRWARDVDHAACDALGIDVVRRPTGGRAILHEHELTYSVVVGLEHSLIGRRGVVHSYRVLSAALQVGLARLGVQSAFAPEQARQGHRPSYESAACFDEPASYEITVGGRKLVGSAQARQHDVLLQHGSLLLHADAARWARVLRLPPTLAPHALKQRMIALDEVLDTKPAFAQVADALAAGFADACGVTLVPGTLTQAEEERAAQLVEEKYANPAWTQRR